MPSSVKTDRLYDTLFELSNDVRHNILLLIIEKPLRMTQIAKKLDLTSPEVSRHLSRLNESKLIQKDLANYYHVTGYGRQILSLIDDIEFSTINREYFVSHNSQGIPTIFKKRLPELSKYQPVNNFIEFLSFIDEKINEANEYVWLLIDQYPITAINSLLKSVESGVKVRIMEQRELSGPNVMFDDKHLLALGTDVPNVMVRVHDRKDVYLFVSDVGSAVSFPSENRFDYSGFVCTNIIDQLWSTDLFNFYWEQATQKMSTPSMLLKEKPKEKGMSITVEAYQDPALNIQAIQNAVDNYDEVLLYGSFNLGSITQQVYDSEGKISPGGLTSIIIKKSVVIKGLGTENGRPATKLFKTGWNFPTNNVISIFRIIGKNAIVRIENLHFTDFDGGAIMAEVCDRAEICNNWFTLDSGVGRGTTFFGQKGGMIDAITFGGNAGKPMYKKGILIENNYLDFAISYVIGGYISKGGKETLPSYRPDENNIQNYVSIGMSVQAACGKVIIRNNTVLNMNARGIMVLDNYDDAEVYIVGNKVSSRVYGSYPFYSKHSGAGILAINAWGRPHSEHYLEISDNEVYLEKINFSGICLFGPIHHGREAKKYSGGVIANNTVHLANGYIGLHLRKADDFDVSGNKILGKMYYGMHLSGSKDIGNKNLTSTGNTFRDNELNEIEVINVDNYSDTYADGRRFAEKDNKGLTGHIWLDQYTSKNKIQVNMNESCIDKGEDNEVIHTDN